MEKIKIEIKPKVFVDDDSGVPVLKVDGKEIKINPRKQQFCKNCQCQSCLDLKKISEEDLVKHRRQKAEWLYRQTYPDEMVSHLMTLYDFRKSQKKEVNVVTNETP